MKKSKNTTKGQPQVGSDARLARLLLRDDLKHLCTSISNVLMNNNYITPKEGSWGDKYWQKHDWRTELEMVTVDVDRLKSDLQNRSFSKLRQVGRKAVVMLCEHLQVIPDETRPSMPKLMERCPHCGQRMPAHLRANG